MHYNQKQKTKKNRAELVITLCFVMAVLSLATAFSNRTSGNMEAYAKKHNCTWQYNGTAYGDSRDQTCK